MAGLDDLMTESSSGASDPKNNDSTSSFIGGSNADMTQSARMHLSGNWGMAILGSLLYFGIVGACYFFIFSLLVFLGLIRAEEFAQPTAGNPMANGIIFLLEFILSGAFIVGFRHFFLGIAQGAGAQLENLFTGFKRLPSVFVAYILRNLFVLLWSLLFIIPGIIAAFRYAMVYYILADDPECGPLEAISRSKQMMAGKKWQFFCLHVRFVGWHLLCSFTGGIGYLWLVPYEQTSFAAFYESVK